jgi:hypothetical protein
LKNWCCAVRLSTAPSPSWACSVTSAMWWSGTFVWSSSVQSLIMVAVIFSINFDFS